MRIRLNYPFNIESILDDLIDYKLNVVYDGVQVTGWLTREFDREGGTLRFMIVDLDTDVNHFIDLAAIRKLDIIQ